MRSATLLFVLMLAAAACAPTERPAGPRTAEPVFTDTALIAGDGTALPLKTWLPADGAPRAVVVALHGFNDYSNFFAGPGAFLAERGIAAYAFDQRGFGAAPDRGYWPGTESLVDDAKAAVTAARARHPSLPVYLLGESMGGAVVLTAVADGGPPGVDGIVLVAPAVWGRQTMPWFQTAALEVAAYTVPWLTLSGRGLGVRPSDNLEMLRAFSQDPLVIKETRMDAVYGLVGLMDAALEAVARLRVPTLILYGERDELVPNDAFDALLAELPRDAAPPVRVLRYAEGYHMLLRDLQAATVLADLAAWVTDPAAPPPSRAAADEGDGERLPL